MVGKGKVTRSKGVEEEFDWVEYFYILLALRRAGERFNIL